MKSRNVLLATFITAVVMSLGSLAVAQQPADELDLDIQQIEIKEVQVNPGDIRAWFQKGVDLQGIQPSSHWMGVVVRPMDPLLKKHLRVEGGLIVQQVAEDSPAASAGIQADDIILSVNDSEVADFKALMEFLTKNGDEEVAISYLREGKKKSAKATPVKRPDSHAKFFAPSVTGQWNLQQKTPEELKKWIEEMARKKAAAGAWKPDGENPLKMRFFHPGVILGGDVDVDVDVDLPSGLQVVVTKKGDEPARIKVTQGDDEWEVTEKDLDKLPKDIQATVKKYLGKGGQLGIRVEAPKAVRVKPLEAARIQRIQPGAARVQAHAIQIDGGITKKLDQINGRLEKIEQSLQKLAEEK